jgi:hypothetical protein
MILLEPANTISTNSLEDQAADHLINRVFGNYDTLQVELSDNQTFRERW